MILMKKLIPFFMLCACFIFAGGPRAEAVTAGDVEINAKAFPDEYFRTYVLEKLDTNKDKILQKAEAEAVREISLKKFKDADDFGEDEQYRPYTKEEFTFDFKGLEHFANLNVLSVNLVGGATADNKEYPVKVTNEGSLYQLKNLTGLEIVKTDLKGFDCSKFPKLEKLRLIQFEELKKITFKGNTKLKKLEMSDLTLDSLNVSSLSGMTFMKLQSVELKKIQFGKKNKALKELWITNYANTYCKNLKTLDLRKLTGLKKLGLEWMKILKKLDLSKNKNLRSIFIERCDKITKLAPKKNKKLAEVDIWNCKKLKTLDLSANHKLGWLRLDGMKIKTIRLSKKNKLVFFRYANAKLKKFDVKNINKKTLKELQLYGNKLKKVDVSKYKNLETIDVDKGVKVTGMKKSK